MRPSSMSSKHADDKNSIRGARHRSRRKRAKLRSDFNATCSYAPNLIMGRRMIAIRGGHRPDLRRRPASFPQSFLCH
jgi:hypothetical protein